MTTSETPTDALPTPAPTQKPRRKLPKRGVRKRVLGKGEGDYCIYQVITEHKVYPHGTLLPIAGTPQFKDSAGAMRWIRRESDDLLSGMQVMILRACELLAVRVQSKPTVVIESKPKVVVTDPSKESGPDA